MAFKLMKSDTFTARADVVAPDGHKYRCDAQFKLPGDDRLAAIEDGEMGDEETLREHLEGWTNFRDYNGEPIEYNADNREQAIATPYIRRALAQAFIAGVYGVGGRRKN
ncbi:hypothetical protein [Arhodomonas sp. AD133]|uniref:hypothetical protein n=1 Tax=Arhodomonas sp. AD133 TaxID=3415009 RepID=UPI003EB93215